MRRLLTGGARVPARCAISHGIETDRRLVFALLAFCLAAGGGKAIMPVGGAATDVAPGLMYSTFAGRSCLLRNDFNGGYRD